VPKRSNNHDINIPLVEYVRSKPGVWFARKDEIARWTLERRGQTLVVHRDAREISGLPGSAA